MSKTFFVAVAGLLTLATAAAAQSNAACDPSITVPTGFCATVVADGIGGPRHIAVAPNGTVYVALETGMGGKGILALRDGQRATFGTPGGTGIAVHDGYLYADAVSAIVRYSLKGSALAPDGPPDTIVRGLPTGGHGARNIAFDRDGRLYVNIGSATNSCQQADRQTGSKGNDPCTELQTRAGIWRFDGSKTGQTPATGEHVVTGLRNGMGLALDPADGRMYATQHGRDQLAENWSALYAPRDGHENPAEELVRISDGADFGWPYCYYDNRYTKLVLAPEYGGDGGHRVDRCASKVAPLVAFPGHWAPMSLAFYSATMFPVRYRGGAFIAFHGSWNRAPDPQAGFRVVFVPLANGSPGKWETFADGFAGTQPIRDPGQAAHRPTGLAVAPDGSLYITDDLHGRIWRVVWRG